MFVVLGHWVCDFCVLLQVCVAFGDLLRDFGAFYLEFRRVGTLGVRFLRFTRGLRGFSGVQGSGPPSPAGALPPCPAGAPGAPKTMKPLRTGAQIAKRDADDDSDSAKHNENQTKCAQIAETDADSDDDGDKTTNTLRTCANYRRRRRHRSKG